MSAQHNTRAVLKRTEGTNFPNLTSRHQLWSCV